MQLCCLVEDGCNVPCAVAQPRKVINRQKKQPLGKLVAAEDVDAVPEEEQEEVIRNMNELWAALTGRQDHAANLLQCIISHRSFSQTVENLFALSFLVRLAAARAACALCPWVMWESYTTIDGDSPLSQRHSSFLRGNNRKGGRVTYADMHAPRAICTPSPLDMVGAEQNQSRMHK